MTTYTYQCCCRPYFTKNLFVVLALYAELRILQGFCDLCRFQNLCLPCSRDFAWQMRLRCHLPACQLPLGTLGQEADTPGGYQTYP